MQKGLKILITGANGQLGSEFSRFLESTNHEVVSLKRNDLEIDNEQQVQSVLSKSNADLLINCAAYTAVDLAESEPEKCLAVNSEALLYLGRECKKNNIRIIHFSTDYVFDGKKEIPYNEFDSANPLGIYGKSKRLGEVNLQSTEARSIIFRVSGVYSIHGNNFPKTISRLLSDREQLSIVNDQTLSPTWTKPLVEFIGTKVLENSDLFSSEIFHYSELGQCTWFDIAEKINERFKKNLLKISTEEFNAKAPRPKYSKLDDSKLRNLFPDYSETWQTNLNTFLKELNE